MKEYKSDFDYYDDIYYIKGLLGKKYYSNRSHGERIAKSEIPHSVLEKIRDYETFYIDSLHEIEKKCNIKYDTESESNLADKVNEAIEMINKNVEEIIFLRARVKELEFEKEQLSKMNQIH